MTSAALFLPLVVAVPWALSFARIPAFERSWRWCDEAVGHRGELLAGLAVAWTPIAAAALMHGEGFGPAAIGAMLAASAVLMAAAGFPVAALVSLGLAPFCERRAIGHDKARYVPGIEHLERRWPEIRQEYARFCEQRRPARVEDVLAGVALTQTTRPEGTWRCVFVRMGGADIETNMRHFPALSAALDAVGADVPLAMFSVLEPGVRLRPHRGYYAGFLRYHLGVVVPAGERAWLQVNGQRYAWREGAGVLFDDMYLHEVGNDGDGARVVLFLDVIRPLPGALDRVHRAVLWTLRVHPYVVWATRRVRSA